MKPFSLLHVYNSSQSTHNASLLLARDLFDVFKTGKGVSYIWTKEWRGNGGVEETA
jgi:hypothetical protein